MRMKRRISPLGGDPVTVDQPAKPGKHLSHEKRSLERANNAGSVFAGIEEIETSYRRNVLGVGRNRKTFVEKVESGLKGH